MASTDPNDSPRSGWSFKEWMNTIVQSFRGGSTKQFLLAGGGVADGAGDPPPILALAARNKARNPSPNGLYPSRMEEAKAKEMMWDNNLYPLVVDRLRKMFHDENYRRMRLTPHVASNILRRIVEDISILYESPARRALSEDKEQKQTDAKAEDAINEAVDEQDVEDGEADVPDEGSDGVDAKGDQPADQPPRQGADGKASPNPEYPAVDTGDEDINALAQFLDIEGAAEEDKQTPLDQVMELCDLDMVLDLVEKKCRFHEAIWVMPKVVYGKTNIKESEGENGELISEEEADVTTGKLTYLVFDPSCADVIEDPDNPSKALAWFYCGWELNMKGEVTMVWNFFTETDYWKFDSEWYTMEHVASELGRLPVTVFRKELPSSMGYYVEGAGRDLFEGTLELCILRTMQNCRFRDSGFKQVVMSNADEEAVPADQIMGGPTPIYLGDGGTASVLDLQPMLTEMSEMCKERSDELANKYGTKFAEHQDGGSPASGFAKKLERDKILKENKRIRKFFAEQEKDLYNLIALTLREYPIEGVPELDPEACLEVDFAEPSFEEDPKNQAVIDAQDLKLNKTSLIDILKRLNPDCNEIELLEMAQRNKEINAIFIKGDQMKLMDLLATSGTDAGSSIAASQGRGGGAPPPGQKPPFGGNTQ